MVDAVIKGLKRLYKERKLSRVYRKYADHTMIPKDSYVRNLALAENVRHVEGCVVECGVWRGGMIAGIADLLGSGREYYLFDSFEGLPPAKAIDGRALKEWQAATTAPEYHDNCRASADDADAAMKKSLATRYLLVKGWFEKTVPQFRPNQRIALLRLDGDLYDSTMICLKHLYPYVASGGIIIIDDYHPWDGCAHAVHEFLANLSDYDDRPRLHQYENDIIFLMKRVRSPEVPLEEPVLRSASRTDHDGDELQRPQVRVAPGKSRR
jgi:O-methyltransferase